MNLEQAKNILLVLADGINPLTGEVLPDGDSCNQVEVVRALNAVLRELERHERTISERRMQRNVQKSEEKNALNAGAAWTKSDDRVLCEMFDSGCSKEEICDRLGRSVGGIAARLKRLGKIEDRSELKNR